MNRDRTLTDKLEIYISTGVAPGVEWANNLYKELDNSDMLLYVYCYNSPPTINDWCSFETGYYAKKSNRQNLITLVAKGVKPPPPLRSFQCVELTETGIKKLLRRLYVDEGIYPDLFDSDFKKSLDAIVDSIITTFSTTRKAIALSPRIWLTIKSDAIKDFKERKINIPDDSLITGETEAARKLGYDFKENEEITIKELFKNAEYKGTLEPYFVVLSDTLQDIINKKTGPWRVPPVKVLTDKAPRILVPAYLEKLANGDHKFEFVVTEPPINFDYPTDNKGVMELYNLFIVAWHFRWRIVHNYLHYFNRIKSADKEFVYKEATIQISKMKVDLNAVILDSINRGLQFPDDVTRNFRDQDKKIMQTIVDTRDGMWKKLLPIFEKACENHDYVSIVDCLEKMQDMNKTCIIISLKLLERLSNENLDGAMNVDF